MSQLMTFSNAEKDCVVIFINLENCGENFSHFNLSNPYYSFNPVLIIFLSQIAAFFHLISLSFIFIF